MTPSWGYADYFFFLNQDLKLLWLLWGSSFLQQHPWKNQNQQWMDLLSYHSSAWVCVCVCLCFKGWSIFSHSTIWLNCCPKTIRNTSHICTWWRAVTPFPGLTWQLHHFDYLKYIFHLLLLLLHLLWSYEWTIVIVFSEICAIIALSLH